MIFPIYLLIYCNDNNIFFLGGGGGWEAEPFLGGEAGHFFFRGGKLLPHKYPR